jgi:exosortase/archaeosortase family protein
VQKILWRESLFRRRSSASLLKLTDAKVLLFYTVALFFIAGVQRFLDGAPVASLFEFNAGELLALVAIYSILRSKNDAVILSRVDFAVISACAMFFLLPVSQHFAFLGAAFAGLYFLLRRPRNAQLFQVGQLWLAIALYESLGRLFFKLVSAPIIRAEVSFIAKAGPLLGFAVSMDGIRLTSPNGWFIYILERCSSFHNVSLAVLVWLSLIKLGRTEVKAGHLIALGAAIVGIICLNGLRILLMTPSQESFTFWHEGSGAIIFSCLTFLAVAVPTAISLGRRG